MSLASEGDSGAVPFVTRAPPSRRWSRGRRHCPHSPHSPHSPLRMAAACARERGCMAGGPVLPSLPRPHLTSSAAPLVVNMPLCNARWRRCFPPRWRRPLVTRRPSRAGPSPLRGPRRPSSALAAWDPFHHCTLQHPLPSWCYRTKRKSVLGWYRLRRPQAEA